MVKFKLVGRTTTLIGKPLWEIIGNLENNGVGRLITRGTYLRYKEPSFFKIMKVEGRTAPSEVKPNEYQKSVRKVIVWIEEIFRGVKSPVYKEILNYTGKSDFQLIPKEDEELLYKQVAECKREMKIIDPHIKMPVFLKELYKEHKINRGEEVPEEPKLEVQIRSTPHTHYRVASKEEVPNYFLGHGFGTPVSPHLYENIEECRHIFVGKNAWDVPAPTKKIDWLLH